MLMGPLSQPIGRAIVRLSFSFPGSSDKHRQGTKWFGKVLCEHFDLLCFVVALPGNKLTQIYITDSH